MESAARGSAGGDRAARGGISLQTLIIASVASAAASFAVARIWGPGTLLGAAAAPVIVALVSETIRRPIRTVAATAKRVPSRRANPADPAAGADGRDSRERSTLRSPFALETGCGDRDGRLRDRRRHLYRSGSAHRPVDHWQWPADHVLRWPVAGDRDIAPNEHGHRKASIGCDHDSSLDRHHDEGGDGYHAEGIETNTGHIDADHFHDDNRAGARRHHRDDAHHCRAVKPKAS